jgi:hypothetical protein
MKPKNFNSIKPNIHEMWAANVLNMQINPGKGPDLIDGRKIVEVKFELMHEDRYTHLCWRVLGFQKDYGNNGKPAYWALGKYYLSKEVSEIKTKDPAKLENMVTSREMFIVPWEWMDQFPVYHQSGKTDRSKWENYMIFAKGRLLPEIKYSKKVEKGIIHFTEGVDKQIFNA